MDMLLSSDNRRVVIDCYRLGNRFHWPVIDFEIDFIVTLVGKYI